ncbi:hypothetical protein ACU686_25595 [Yinghuangia aomiensis]
MAVLLTIGLLLLGLGATVPAAADTTSTLEKSVRNATHPGAATADHGDTLDWTVRYRNATTGDTPPPPPSPTRSRARAAPRPTCPAR